MLISSKDPEVTAYPAEENSGYESTCILNLTNFPVETDSDIYWLDMDDPTREGPYPSLLELQNNQEVKSYFLKNPEEFLERSNCTEEIGDRLMRSRGGDRQGNTTQNSTKPIPTEP